MNAIKFRFTFALIMAGVLSAAGVAELARAASLADASCPDEAGVFEGVADSGGGGGDDVVEVRWTSLIPGTFK